MSFKLYPQGYDHWLADRLTTHIQEFAATCNNCAMVKPEGITRDQGPFLNHLKCCTYFPFIPNFSLGSLTTTDLNKVCERGLFLPIGLYPSTIEQEKIKTIGYDGFGKNEKLLCPFFDKQQNQCSIWSSRPGVCTSYFCKSDRGQKGLDFWKNVESYLNHFEWQLAKAIIEKMDLDENTLSYCQAALSTDTDSDERPFFIDAAWGTWIDKQHEFYQKARQIAFNFSTNDLDHILETDYLNLEKQINKGI